MTDQNMKSGKSEHHHKAEDIPQVRVSIVTVSDSRTFETDVNGKYLCDQIKQVDFKLIDYRLIKDEVLEINRVLDELSQTETQVIVFNGGTGLSRRDSTYDIISEKLDKVIPGFGEIFRMLSYEQVGAAAMLSRALAGVYRSKIVFLTPGSPAAVQLAWEKLISPELKHLIWEINR